MNTARHVAARYEAGHGAVALALRLRVEAARINPEDDTPGQTLIEQHSDLATEDRIAHWAWRAWASSIEIRPARGV